jgi:Pyruvate/2-oxoacid:ferredoxin oxidoreductase delta subunit
MLGVKNTFGCVVGLRKPEWHLRAGVDPVVFADVLARIHRAVRPAITLLDGVLGMEGEGPGRAGTPRTFGVLLAGREAAAVDAAVSLMFGLGEDGLLTTRAARATGLLSGALEIDGELPLFSDVRIPGSSPPLIGRRRLLRVVRRQLLRRPVCDAKSCRLCGECWRLCPAKAIGAATRGLRFDYDRCIRCYCCIEVCPHAALAARETLVGRLVGHLVRR